MGVKQKMFLNMLVSQVGFISLILLCYMEMGVFVLTIVGVIFIAVVAGINFILTNQLSNGLKRYDEYFKEFLSFITMKQNKIERVEVVGSDEIAVLLKELNHAVDSFEHKMQSDMKVMGEIVLTLDKVEQGIYKCRVKANTENPMIETLKNTINKMLTTVESDMVNLMTVLVEYSNDDYRNQVSVSPKLKDRMLAVMNSVNALGNTLSSGAKGNLSNGQVLESNANTMTSSMQNLAAKANEQAASLEETAAAVEEITSITRNNAENAVKMADLGQTVRSSVSNGQGLASQTASSMDEINEKVTSINESITVIDQIAFQTNILSLNAAVEAATAGEAGKGFAVVAAEVRNLASRSAEAAKEIKDLVEDANMKANEGKKISDSMIKGYEELNTHIGETIHIIEDVSAASKEQMTGIEQINDAVTMLDRVTQENASEANNVSQIAQEVQSIAHQLVDDAKSKQFN